MPEDRSQPSPCPPEDDLLAFSSGDVSEAVRATLIGHLASCDECRMVTSELSKDRLGYAATATPDFSRIDEQLPLPAVPYERGARLTFSPGETIAGKFKVVKVLGSGGMGVVIEAEHLLLQQRVALKFMGPQVASDPEATRRFLREARAAAGIPSEHVVKILDVATLDDGAPYIVMERLEGADLSTVLEREGRLEASRAVGYVLEAMEALAHAHGKGIVHRDLKPANLFLAARDDGSRVVKVLDFGIAKAEEQPGSPGVTTSRTVLGSPRYMAPEQMQSAKDVDMRADIWALGTILFELVAGRPAFVGDTLAALTVAICAGEKPSLSEAFPPVSPALAAAVSGCLERSRDARTRDVAALARALCPLGPPSARASMERIVATLPSSVGEPARASSRTCVEPPARADAEAAIGAQSVPPVSVHDRTSPVGTKRIVAAAVILGVLGLGGGIYVGLRPSKPTPLAGPTSEPASPAPRAPEPRMESTLQSPSSAILVAPLSSTAPGKGPIGVQMPLPTGGKKPLASASASTTHAPPLPPASASPYDERK